MALAPAEPRPSPARPFATAIKEALGAALVALGLSVPILSLRTEQNISNQLILQPRWTYVAVAVAAAFVGRLLYLAAAAASARRTPRAAAPAWVAPGGLARVVSVVGLAILLLYPLLALGLAGRAGAVKWIDNFGVQILIYIMLGWGLNIVVGLAGLLDLGYVAFYAVGAYSTALLALNFQLSFWLCLPLAGILAAFWGVLLGFPVLRLRGDYLAIVTLAFGEIIRLVLINWVPVTNGYAGITSIPRPSFFGLPFNASDDGFAAFFGIEFSPLHRLIFLFYVILALALLTNWVTLRLRRLPIGRAWEALREDEIACRSLGINTTNTKLTAFAIGAGFGGFAGSFFAARQGFISPESFTFMESAVVLAIVVLGGMGSQVGVAIAAVAMIGGTEILRELDWLKDIFGPSFDPTQYRMLLFGFAMVLVMIWRPRGLISFRQPSIFLRKSKPVRSGMVREGAGLMAAPAPPLLLVEHLTMRFGGLVAIDDLTFSAARGDITAIIGPNGAGKTTVFNCITGFYKPTCGRMLLGLGDALEAADIAALTQSGRRLRVLASGAAFLLERMPDFEIAAKARVARTFQNIRLFAGMTVLENLIVAQHNALMRASAWSIAGLLGLARYRNAEAEAVERARAWLDRIGLTDRADDPAGDLPYGDQRRLEIARAMCSGPALLCLDEPAAGLNPRETAELKVFLRSIRDEHGTSILLIEHDMSVVMEISDHVVVLEYGRKISDGSPEHVRNDPKVIAAYLGVEDEEVAQVEAEIAR